MRRNMAVRAAAGDNNATMVMSIEAMVGLTGGEHRHSYILEQTGERKRGLPLRAPDGLTPLLLLQTARLATAARGVSSAGPRLTGC